MQRGYVPGRGDVVWITLNPQAGREQTGRRPALILSPQTYNGRVGLAILCPITSQIKGSPFEVRIPPGSKVEGVVLSDQAKSLDWKARQTEFIGRVSKATMLEVLQKLRTLITPGEW